MSINELPKKEIVDMLQISEYYRDALHFGVKDIGRILNVTTNDMNDEELINIVTGSFLEFVNNLPSDIQDRLNKS